MRRMTALPAWLRCRAVLARSLRDAGTERGGVAALVAVMLATGAVFGVGALAVDGGVLYTARRQVQTGADAAAFALAQACAKKDASSCTTDPGTLDALVSDNAPIGRDSSVYGSCIHDVSANTTQGVCDGPDVKVLTKCPYGLPTRSSAVQVRAHSEVPRFFAAIWGTSATDVGVCASAAWGPLTAMTTTIPFTVDLCEWGVNTTEGTVFPGPEMSLALKDKSDACKPFNGNNAPGAFGWLDYDKSGCAIPVVVNNPTGGSPGKGKGNHCGDEIARALGTVVYFPIFDSVSGQGQDTDYHIVGFAAFFLTGYDLPAVGAARVSGPSPCAAAAVAPALPSQTANNGKGSGDDETDDQSFSGCFLKTIVSTGSIDDSGASMDLGLNVVQMVG